MYASDRRCHLASKGHMTLKTVKLENDPLLQVCETSLENINMLPLSPKKTKSY